MTDTTHPGGSAAGTGRRISPIRCLRLSLSGLLLSGALLLAATGDWFRSIESIAAGPLVRFCTGGHVVVRPAYKTVFFDLYTRRAFGLTITPECTAALPVAALLAIAGAIVLSRRFVLTRVLGALLAAVVGVFAVNEGRVALIAWSTHHWGLSGYGWSHSTAGSLLSIVGVTAAIAGFFAIAVRGASPRPAHEPAPPSVTSEV